MTKQKARQTFTVLHFMLSQVNACLDIEAIDKILLLPQLEKVPGGPNYLAGLMNYEGKSIPVIDLALKLEMSREKNYTVDTPVLLCKNQKKLYGLIIDQVLNFSQVNWENLQMSDEFAKTDSPFMAAVNKQDKLSLLINLKNVMAEVL